MFLWLTVQTMTNVLKDFTVAIPSLGPSVLTFPMALVLPALMGNRLDINAAVLMDSDLNLAILTVQTVMNLVIVSKSMCVNQCDETEYPSGTYYAHQCNDLSECNEDSGQIYYQCDCIPGTQHIVDTVTFDNGDETNNVCEDYEGHSYGACPDGNVDCCPKTSLGS